MKSYALKATCIARNLGIYILYDADALDLISQTEQSIQGYHSSVITPNINEFNKLIDRFAINVPDDKKAISLSKALGGVTVLQKGAQDIIAVDTTTDNNPDDQPTVELIKLDIPGGLKRCGGQGDVLSGLVGTMLAWGKCYQDGIFGYPSFSFFHSSQSTYQKIGITLSPHHVSLSLPPLEEASSPVPPAVVLSTNREGASSLRISFPK